MGEKPSNLAQYSHDVNMNSCMVVSTQKSVTTNENIFQKSQNCVWNNKNTQPLSYPTNEPINSNDNIYSPVSKQNAVPDASLSYDFNGNPVSMEYFSRGVPKSASHTVQSPWNSHAPIYQPSKPIRPGIPPGTLLPYYSSSAASMSQKSVVARSQIPSSHQVNRYLQCLEKSREISVASGERCNQYIPFMQTSGECGDVAKMADNLNLPPPYPKTNRGKSGSKEDVVSVATGFMDSNNLELYRTSNRRDTQEKSSGIPNANQINTYASNTSASSISQPTTCQPGQQPRENISGSSASILVQTSQVTSSFISIGQNTVSQPRNHQLVKPPPNNMSNNGGLSVNLLSSGNGYKSIYPVSHNTVKNNSNSSNSEVVLEWLDISDAIDIYVKLKLTSSLEDSVEEIEKGRVQRMNQLRKRLGLSIQASANMGNNDLPSSVPTTAANCAIATNPKSTSDIISKPNDQFSKPVPTIKIKPFSELQDPRNANRPANIDSAKSIAQEMKISNLSNHNPPDRVVNNVCENSSLNAVNRIPLNTTTNPQNRTDLRIEMPFSNNLKCTDRSLNAISKNSINDSPKIKSICTIANQPNLTATRIETVNVCNSKTSGTSPVLLPGNSSGDAPKIKSVQSLSNHQNSTPTRMQTTHADNFKSPKALSDNSRNVTAKIMVANRTTNPKMDASPIACFDLSQCSLDEEKCVTVLHSNVLQKDLRLSPDNKRKSDSAISRHDEKRNRSTVMNSTLSSKSSSKESNLPIVEASKKSSSHHFQGITPNSNSNARLKSLLNNSAEGKSLNKGDLSLKQLLNSSETDIGSKTTNTSRLPILPVTKDESPNRPKITLSLSSKKSRTVSSSVDNEVATLFSSSGQMATITEVPVGKVMQKRKSIVNNLETKYPKADVNDIYIPDIVVQKSIDCISDSNLKSDQVNANDNFPKHSSPVGDSNFSNTSHGIASKNSTVSKPHQNCLVSKPTEDSVVSKPYQNSNVSEPRKSTTAPTYSDLVKPGTSNFVSVLCVHTNPCNRKDKSKRRKEKRFLKAIPLKAPGDNSTFSENKSTTIVTHSNQSNLKENETTKYIDSVDKFSNTRTEEEKRGKQSGEYRNDTPRDIDVQSTDASVTRKAEVKKSKMNIDSKVPNKKLKTSEQSTSKGSKLHQEKSEPHGHVGDTKSTDGVVRQIVEFDIFDGVRPEMLLEENKVLKNPKRKPNDRNQSIKPCFVRLDKSKILDEYAKLVSSVGFEKAPKFNYFLYLKKTQISKSDDRISEVSEKNCSSDSLHSREPSASETIVSIKETEENKTCSQNKSIEVKVVEINTKTDVFKKRSENDFDNSDAMPIVIASVHSLPEECIDDKPLNENLEVAFPAMSSVSRSSTGNGSSGEKLNSKDIQKNKDIAACKTDQLSKTICWNLDNLMKRDTKIDSATSKVNKISNWAKRGFFGGEYKNHKNGITYSDGVIKNSSKDKSSLKAARHSGLPPVVPFQQRTFYRKGQISPLTPGSETPSSIGTIVNNESYSIGNDPPTDGEMDSQKPQKESVNISSSNPDGKDKIKINATAKSHSPKRRYSFEEYTNLRKSHKSSAEKSNKLVVHGKDGRGERTSNNKTKAPSLNCGVNGSPLKESTASRKFNGEASCVKLTADNLAFTKESDNKYICHVCNRTFDSYVSFNVHSHKK